MKIKTFSEYLIPTLYLSVTRNRAINRRGRDTHEDKGTQGYEVRRMQEVSLPTRGISRGLLPFHVSFLAYERV